MSSPASVDVLPGFVEFVVHGFVVFVEVLGIVSEWVLTFVVIVVVVVSIDNYVGLSLGLLQV